MNTQENVTTSHIISNTTNDNDTNKEIDQEQELKNMMDALRPKTPLSEAKNFGEYLLAEPVTAAEKWDMRSCSCWTACTLIAGASVPVLQYNEKVTGGMLALSGLCALGAILSTVISASCDSWQEHKLKKKAMEKIWQEHGANVRG
ncbi:MAG: hypothetical protein IKY98_02705 [Alphaproteobacteria bacterium]|nr:hypothetical protein [Alphaproteobacteria bacterium]